MAAYEIAVSEIAPENVLAMTYTTDINHADIVVDAKTACTPAGAEPIRKFPPLPRRE